MKRLIILALIALTAILLPYTLKAQSLDLDVQIHPEDRVTFRMADDKWQGEDKKDHILGGVATMALSSIVFDTDTDDQILTLAAYNVGFWFVWELKDSITPWEEYGWWGGDGFSYKDVAASAVGVGFIAGFVLLIK